MPAHQEDTVPSRPITSPHPVTTVILTTVSLILLLGLGGTVIYLTGLPLDSPVALVFAPIAVGLSIWASVTRRWGILGFGRPRVRGNRAAWRLVLLPLLAVFLLVLTSTGGAAEQSAGAWLGLIGFVALVGFVEETLFRSVFLRLLAPTGPRTAVLVSTAAFALAHAVNLLGGQDLLSTLGQIGFAAAYGLFAACAFLRTGSIWALVAFHALFDLAQLSSVRQTASLMDAVITVILLAGALWLWAGIRQSGAEQSRPTDAGTANRSTTLGTAPTAV